jgi:SnoaL-like domain
MSTTTTSTLDLDDFAAAIESRNAESVSSHYAKDATLTLFDRDHPPAAPTVYHGIDEISAYYRDICGRNLDHEVTDRVSTPDSIAFVQRCQYSSGERVVCATVATVQGGAITSQTAVQVWDS